MIIGINSDHDQEIPKQLLEDGTVTWRSFQNNGPETSISDTWGVRAWPTVHVLDATGKIRFKNVRGKKIDDAVRTLLEEMGEVWPEFEHEEEDDAKDKDKRDNEDDSAGHP